MAYLRDKYGWQMSSSQLHRRLGLKPTAPIPKDYTTFLQPQDIDGVQVYVIKPPVEGGRKHRVWCICPDCGKHVPAGRLQQHRKNTKGHFYEPANITKGA